MFSATKILVGKHFVFWLLNIWSPKVSHFFGTKVTVKMSKNGKGSLTIPFSSEEDFKRIQSLLHKKDE